MSIYLHIQMVCFINQGHPTAIAIHSILRECPGGCGDSQKAQAQALESSSGGGKVSPYIYITIYTSIYIHT